MIDDVVYAKAKGNERSTSNAQAKSISPFTEEHELFRQAVRDFLNKEAVPYVDQWEKDGECPRSIYEKFGEMECLSG